MHGFIARAHHEPKSFNGALTEAIRDTIVTKEHKASNSDLYTMDVNPVPCRPLSDFDQKTLRLKTEF
jgi:NAD(P)H dehydrogenase (quinone)